MIMLIMLSFFLSTVIVGIPLALIASLITFILYKSNVGFVVKTVDKIIFE